MLFILKVESNFHIERRTTNKFLKQISIWCYLLQSNNLLALVISYIFFINCVQRALSGIEFLSVIGR